MGKGEVTAMRRPAAIANRAFARVPVQTELRRDQHLGGDICGASRVDLGRRKTNAAARLPRILSNSRRERHIISVIQQHSQTFSERFPKLFLYINK